MQERIAIITDIRHYLNTSKSLMRLRLGLAMGLGGTRRTLSLLGEEQAHKGLVCVASLC